MSTHARTVRTYPPPIVTTIFALALLAALKTILFLLLRPALVSFNLPNRSSDNNESRKKNGCKKIMKINKTIKK